MTLCPTSANPNSFPGIRRIFANAADQSSVSFPLERKQREKIRVIELEIDLAVYGRSVSFDVRDVEQCRVSPTGESNVQRFADCRMSAIASCDVDGVADFFGSIRFF